MLPHPTHDRLIALGLLGMAKAFEEQRQQPAVASLTFEERLGLLVDREAVERESKRLVTRLKFANLRQNATVEDLNTRAARGLDKALFAKLATGDWIGRRHDLLVGVSAPRVPLSRCRRQSVSVDEYKPSRRRIAPIPPMPAAPSVSARTRSFVCAVKVRRRGRSR